MLMTACAGMATSTSAEPLVQEVFHIVEDPGGVEQLVDCEVPTEYYYERLAEDMARRHPKANRFLLEHLSELEPFLDVSILSGFSYGINKASVAFMTGSLLGHQVGRDGSAHEPEKTDYPQSCTVEKFELSGCIQVLKGLSSCSGVNHDDS